MASDSESVKRRIREAAWGNPRLSGSWTREQREEERRDDTRQQEDD